MNTNKLIILGIILAAILGGAYWLLKSAPQEEPISPAVSPESAPPLSTRDIFYFDNARGFYAAPAEPGNYPGVVMIHEWWGLNSHIKETAKKLAGEGYQVLAVDLYYGEVAETREKAQQLSRSLDQKKALENMKAAARYLRSQNASQIASLGWCFGGGQSLQLALSGENLAATVIYYGTLVTEQKPLSKIQWPVLGIFGDKDQSIPVAKVKAFETSLNQLKIENEIHIYPGVGHAFANPSGDNYSPKETQDAWDKTLQFLKNSLKQPQ
ncbi:MAG: dienelactone hydrolase family protein [Parcubacteria group bacterium]|nr:dienelactone hydrolase family protein [Parcubacteria group bacterium]